MPIDTITEARDEILTFVTAAWNTITPTVPPLVYDDKADSIPSSGTWGRVTVQHNVMAQVTLGGKTAIGGGGRRFSRNGLVTIQIFTDDYDGLTSGDSLVDLLLDALEGEETGSDRVWFRNVRANEVGSDGSFYQINVTAEFEYDRVK